MRERYQPEKYDADEVGFYSRTFFEQTGIKARPFLEDDDDGRVLIDEPGMAATRAQKQYHTTRTNGEYVHPTTKGLGEQFEHPLVPGTPVTITQIEWEDLPEDH